MENEIYVIYKYVESHTGNFFFKLTTRDPNKEPKARNSAARWQKHLILWSEHEEEIEKRYAQILNDAWVREQSCLNLPLPNNALALTGG